jgi:hypothetical protein
MYNIRSFALSFGLASRKRVLVASPKWAKQAAATDPLAQQLIDLVIAIPELLERTTQLVSHGTNDIVECYELLAKCVREEQLLQSWAARWIRTLPVSPYRTVPIVTFPEFALSTADLDFVDGMVLDFHSFAEASMQLTLWTGLLHIKEATLQLLAFTRDRDLLRVRWTAMLEDCNECAVLLCQSLPFVLQRKYGHCGYLRSLAPLHFAAQWFVKRRDEPRLNWCLAVMARNEAARRYTSPYAGKSHEGGEDIIPRLLAD